jgi:predicted transcriptional regulator
VPDATDAIISIRPHYANAILAGTKTVELRRRIPKLFPGVRLWIYATRPTGAVVGLATIKAVIQAHPAIVWKKHRADTGVDHTSFKAYFDGSPVAFAILLTAPRRVTPVTIEELRGIRDHFCPPQVLTRLSPSEAAALQDLVRRKIDAPVQMAHPLPLTSHISANCAPP